jgi:pyruvate kinase
MLKLDDKYIFTISTPTQGACPMGGPFRIGVNYDGFVDDVSVGDTILVDGGIQTFKVLSKTKTDVEVKVVDGGEFKCGGDFYRAPVKSCPLALQAPTNPKTNASPICPFPNPKHRSRRHLNIRGKSANLPAITDRDWEDLRWGVERDVDYIALSFVRDAQVTSGCLPCCCSRCRLISSFSMYL